MPILTQQIQLVDAGNKSPSDAGYDHGCDDAGISDPSDRYINQPEKGPSFHTDEFIQGYNAGYNNCSGGDSTAASGSSQTDSYDDGYDDGYDEGCYDAGRDLKGLDGHGYDDSINHGNSQFRVGYVDGYRVCWNSGNSQPAPATGRESSSDSGNSEGSSIRNGAESRRSLVDKVCNFAQSNPSVAVAAAKVLGYNGLGIAVGVLCATR